MELFRRIPRDAYKLDPREDFDLNIILMAAQPGLELVTRPVSEPTPDDECGICRDDFEDVPGVTPKVCPHTYHLECLSQWFEHRKKSRVKTLTCGLCTKFICSEYSLQCEVWNNRSDDEGHVRFWQTPEQYWKSQEAKKP